MENVEFKSFEKITRGNPFIGTITEKIDGTNACIVVKDKNIIAIQSRNQFITIENDNYNFAKWVNENKDELANLGNGYHYGEWAGEGIQKNPLKLIGKQFFLFNTFRKEWPKCCKQVPILYEGNLSMEIINKTLDNLKNLNDGLIHEGIVVYYHALRSFTKHTIISPKGKWADKN